MPGLAGGPGGEREGGFDTYKLLGYYRTDGAPPASWALWLQGGPFALERIASLLAGICSPEKVGSQAITLAGNGVRADTQLVMGGGPGTTRARRSHHGALCRITTTSRELSIATPPHPPSPPVLGSILGGFGWSFPKLILSQRKDCGLITSVGSAGPFCSTHTNVDRYSGMLSITALPRLVGRGLWRGWGLEFGQGTVYIEMRNATLSFMKLLRIFKSKDPSEATPSLPQALGAMKSSAQWQTVPRTARGPEQQEALF